MSNNALTCKLSIKISKVGLAGKAEILKHPEKTVQKLMIAVGRIDEPTRFVIRSFPKFIFLQGFVGCSWGGLPLGLPHQDAED